LGKISPRVHCRAQEASSAALAQGCDVVRQ